MTTREQKLALIVEVELRQGEYGECTFAETAKKIIAELKRRGALSPDPMETPPMKYRHKPSGGIYTVIKQEGVRVIGTRADAVVYEAPDGLWFVRDKTEFFDGRFEPFTETPPATTPSTEDDGRSKSPCGGASATCKKCGETYLTNWAHVCGELNPDKERINMQTISQIKVGRYLFTWKEGNGPWWFVSETGEFKEHIYGPLPCEGLYRAEGIKDPPSRDKPLAQGKPARGGAKGKPARGRRKAGKVSRTKRSSGSTESGA